MLAVMLGMSLLISPQLFNVCAQDSGLFYEFIFWDWYYKLLEIIVVDDGSTDGSFRVAKRYGNEIKYYQQENQGPAAAQNLGVSVSKGDYIGFLDADDLWTKDKIALQLKAFQKNLRLDMTFGYVKQFYSPEVNENFRTKIYCPVLSMPGLNVGSMLVRRSSFFRVGEFSTNWKIAPFFDWYSRAREKDLEEIMLSQVLYLRRLHENNMGIHKRQHYVEYVRMIKASLDRRRCKENADVLDSR